MDRIRGSRNRYYCRIQTIASPPILSATRTKCQTLNERYIFGPRGKTLVLRLAQLASLLAAETIDEDALCASIVRIVESQRSPWKQIPERRVMVLPSEIVAKLTLARHVASDFYDEPYLKSSRVSSSRSRRSTSR